MLRSLVSIALIGCAPSIRPARAAPWAADAKFNEICAVSVPADYPTVQDAVLAASDGDTVCVDAGTWVGLVDLAARDLRIAGHGAHRTFLDGGGLGATVVAASSTLTLAGLTVTGGVSQGGGGGVSTTYSDLTLENVVVTGNTADQAGGGVFVERGSLHVAGARVTKNYAGFSGGGVWVDQGSIDGAGLAAVRNESGGIGGGLFTSFSSVALDNSAFIGNFADTEGGGVYSQGASGTLSNVRIAANTAAGHGGGISYGQADALVLVNAALLRNHAADGAAAHVTDPSALPALFTNTIIAGNLANLAVGGVLVDSAAAATFAYCDFWGNSGLLVTTGYPSPIGVNGTIAADPQFVKPGGGDLHLTPGSALIDAGDPAIADPDGSRSDIGSYGGPLAL